MRKAGAALVLLLVLSCRRTVDDAEALINAGKLPEAEQMLLKAANQHPKDLDVRIALGRVYLLEARVQDADTVLLPLTSDKKYTTRIANEYREAAVRLAKQRSAYFEMAQAAGTAARLDPLLHDSVGQLLIDHFDPALGLDPIAKAAAGIDAACKKKTIDTLVAMVKKTPTASADPDTLERICHAAEEESSLECARAIRDVAQKIGTSDRQRTAKLVEAAGRINSDVTSELETVVLRSSIGDTSAVAAPSPANDILSRYTGSPLDVTKRMMREIASALDLYASQKGHFPANVTNIDQLANLLAGYLSNPVPARDAWGGEFVYVSPVGMSRARLISGGADNHVEAESRVVGGPKRGQLDEYGADIVWEDGQFIQEPLERALHKYDATPAKH